MLETLKPGALVPTSNAKFVPRELPAACSLGHRSKTNNEPTMDSSSHALTTLRVVAVLRDGVPRTAKELMKATGLSDNTISRQVKYMREMSPPLIEADAEAPRTNGPGPVPKRWKWTAT